MATKRKKIEYNPELFFRLKRFMSPALVSRILSAESTDPYGVVAKRKRVTFMFLDIRNFTEMSDELEPEVVTDVLGHA